MSVQPPKGYRTKVYAVGLSTGMAIGVITRLILIGSRSNEQILSSYYGLAAVLCIGGSIASMLSIKLRPRRNGGIMYLLSMVAFAAGIMWVVPLPF
jgi:uncharacterized membrane protein HdeD (DUF308 family)